MEPGAGVNRPSLAAIFLYNRVTRHQRVVFMYLKSKKGGKTMRAFAVIALLIIVSVNAPSQNSSSQTRSQQIAVSFSKQKHVVKEKNGVRTEKYKDVRSESVVKPNIRDYSGVYEVSDLGYMINVQVSSDGTVQANGHEKTSRTFRLENARIEGALLTGTKVYGDGTKEEFEGVFMNRTERNSPTDAGVTRFGLGVILHTPVELGGITYERLFYQLK